MPVESKFEKEIGDCRSIGEETRTGEEQDMQRGHAERASGETRQMMRLSRERPLPVVVYIAPRSRTLQRLHEDLSSRQAAEVESSKVRTRGTQTPEASVRRVQAETERREKMEQEALGGGSDGVKGRSRNDEREKEEEEEANDTCNTPREVREAMKWFNTWGTCGRQVTMEYYNRLPERWRRRVSSCAVSDWPGARRPSAAERGRWETEPFIWCDDWDLGAIRIRIAVCPLTQREDIAVKIRREKLDVCVDGQADVSRYLKGRLQHAVKAEGSVWDLYGEGEDRRLEIKMCKRVKAQSWLRLFREDEVESEIVVWRMPRDTKVRELREANERELEGVWQKWQAEDEAEAIKQLRSDNPASEACGDEEPEKPEPDDLRTPEQKEAEELKNKGNELYKKKQFARALEMYDKAIEKEPNDLTYYNNKCAVWIEMGEEKYDSVLETGMDLVSRRLAINAANPGGASLEKVAKVFCRMASVHVRRHDYNQAKAMYQKALTEDNSRSTREALREVELAEDKLENECRLDPVKAEEHRTKGNRLFAAKDWAAAKAEYDEGIKRNPEDPRLYLNRAAALTKLKAYSDALKDLDFREAQLMWRLPKTDHAEGISKRAAATAERSEELKNTTQRKGSNPNGEKRKSSAVWNGAGGNKTLME